MFLIFLPKRNIRFQWKFGNHFLANRLPLMTFDLQMILLTACISNLLRFQYGYIKKYRYLNMIGISNGFKCLFHFLISRLSSQIKRFINLQKINENTFLSGALIDISLVALTWNSYFACNYWFQLQKHLAILRIKLTLFPWKTGHCFHEKPLLK